MYIKKGKLGFYKTVNAVIIAVAGISAFGNFLFALGVLLSDEFGDDPRTPGMCAFIFFLMLIKIGIIIWRVILIHRILKCRIYNSIIEEDHDGVIEYASIASMIGRPEANVIKDMMWLVKEKIIINVTLTRTAVVVNMKPGLNEFVTVACPTCGSHLSINRNGGGRCEHCGTFMRLKENQNV